MKKTMATLLLVLAASFAVAGGYTSFRGLDARRQVRTELLRQNITTPPDAAIPNATVRDARTAQAMADIVDAHARKATGGLTFGEMGRFVAADGDRVGTSDPAKAVRGSDGQPVRNPVRAVALEASTVQTGLYTSIMALNLADLVVGIGALILVLGLVLAGGGLALAGATLPVRRPRQLLAPSEA